MNAVNTRGLSKLQWWILVSIGPNTGKLRHGLTCSEIKANCYGRDLPLLQSRRANAAICRAIRRLEERGLIEVDRYMCADVEGHYLYIHATPAGMEYRNKPG